jgi:lipopolysaccharide biosynthesis glycosyltransferase
MLQSAHKDKCKFVFVNMGDEYKDSFISRNINQVTYYRLKMSSRLPNNVRKCIYMDVDTIVCKDLKELFSVNIDGKYLAGVPDTQRAYPCDDNIKKFDHYICAGIMLINLSKFREECIEQKFNEYLSRITKPTYHDQSVINEICYDGIIDLPCKFGLPAYIQPNTLWNDNKYAKKIFSESDWDEGRKNPTIIHYGGIKPWSRIKTTGFWERWWQWSFRSPFKADIEKKYFKNFSNEDQNIIKSIIEDV